MDVMRQRGDEHGAPMQVSLSDSDVIRVAQAVADLLAPKLGARPDLPPVMTLKKVCECTGMGKTRLLDMIKAGTFPRHFEGGGRGSTKLWRGSDIRQWLEDSKNKLKKEVRADERARSIERNDSR